MVEPGVLTLYCDSKQYDEVSNLSHGMQTKYIDMLYFYICSSSPGNTGVSQDRPSFFLVWHCRKLAFPAHIFHTRENKFCKL
jgi:hypothetical protein